MWRSKTPAAVSSAAAAAALCVALLLAAVTTARANAATSSADGHALLATADPNNLEILSCQATPRVLPWTECPRAALSAGRLVGHCLDDLRRFVRADLVGTSTCTHLNDLLRSLADVEPLLRYDR